ncbi:hypothetical protein SKUN_001455 [Spiroplasma kunkelii CR2-3x]|uniref:Uncharacterized protein n=1 Tax=Spiroplasma kunkelii CR2-3x TaxID=273035 RepID=A0A0K2JIA3_SPIKU|nr:hypothetical protein SKUN_001455 [Spiroplasma kunkelii CR2-3x]
MEQSVKKSEKKLSTHITIPILAIKGILTKTLLLGMAKHPILYGVLVSLSALAAGGVWLYNKFNKPPQNINQESQTNNYNKIKNKNEFKPTIII